MKNLTLKKLKELMALQETESGDGYLIPCDVMNELIEEIKRQPKGKLLSEFMAERGFLLVSQCKTPEL